MNTDVLVWVDLEMTGLDPQKDEICEIAVVVTDAQLTVKDVGIDLLVRPSDAALERMNDQVRKLHTKSGLLEELTQATRTVGEAEREVLAYIQQHVKEPMSTPLCGNSIGVDRGFLACYMPSVNEFLHYRNIDVSSIKELCRRWYPEVFAQAPKKKEAHRAMDDIRESIAELMWYRERIFVTR